MFAKRLFLTYPEIRSIKTRNWETCGNDGSWGIHSQLRSILPAKQGTGCFPYLRKEGYEFSIPRFCHTSDLRFFIQ